MITGKTKIVGIFGDPIEHTLSPIIHNAAFRELKIDYCYVPFLVKREKLKEATEAIRALNMVGVNITVPHKEAVIEYLDELSDEAKFIGAVNTILNEGGKLIGYNTDSYGFVKSLKEEGIELNDKNILLLGAGGAAKAVAYGVLREGANLFVFNRTHSKAYSLRESFNSIGKVEVLEKLDRDKIEYFQIVINSTSLGLKKEDPMPIHPSYLSNRHIYIDLIYFETPLMKEAAKRGAKVISGLGMLLWQAVRAFEIWTKRVAPVEVMTKILKK